MLHDTDRLDSGASVPLYVPTKGGLQGIGINVRSKSANYSAINGDYIKGDATSASFTIDLPTASTNLGTRIVIFKSDATVNTITVDGSGSDLINGSLTQVLTSQYDSMPVWCDGVEWFIE